MAQKQLVKRSRQSFTRLARFINQLMGEPLFCGPVTVQQCYTLEALIGGPKTMNALAAEVALHQSTMTRIVEKLERQKLVRRQRKENNKRSVEVQITETGKQTHSGGLFACRLHVAHDINGVSAANPRAVLGQLFHVVTASLAAFARNERGTAPPVPPASDADLVYEPVDDGWPGYDEPTYTYH
jgi:hypothetical protein